MLPAFMREITYDSNIRKLIPPIVYEMEIAMLEGDIAKGLQLRAQYILDSAWRNDDYVYDEYVYCAAPYRRASEFGELTKYTASARSTLDFVCFRDPVHYLLIDIPYISADGGRLIDFFWNKPLTYYSGDKETGWHRQSTSSPDQIIAEFYVNIKGCVVPRSSGGYRRPTDLERQCVNQVARSMASGQ
jgi:hypothetical protein